MGDLAELKDGIFGVMERSAPKVRLGHSDLKYRWTYKKGKLGEFVSGIHKRETF